MDTTSVQALIDTRSEVERWANESVEVRIYLKFPVESYCLRLSQFHFSSVRSPWTRRALVAGGFGFERPRGSSPAEVTSVVPPFENLRDDRDQDNKVDDSEQLYGRRDGSRESGSSQEYINESALTLDDMPFFHFDLATAVRAAERNTGTSPSGRSSVMEKK